MTTKPATPLPWTPAIGTASNSLFRVRMAAFNGAVKFVDVLAPNCECAEDWALQQNPAFISAEAV